MNNAPALIRSLIVYGICVPLALVTGFLLTNPLDISTFIFAGLFALLLGIPFLLKWHQPLLMFSWHTGISLFFLKGQPDLWLVMVMLSLGISVLERTMNSQMRFIRVPQMTWPLILLFAVTVFTAELNGGFGFRSMGSAFYGGKRYAFLFIGIASYFALTARKIPSGRVWLCVGLFFLGPAINAVGDFYSVAPRWMTVAFLFFRPTFATSDFEFGETRLGGVGTAGSAIFLWLVARYGLRGILLSNKFWRPVLLAAAVGLVFLGGFRSALLMLTFVFGVTFYLERLHRTWLLPVFAALGVVGALVIIPMADKLPFTVQRTLAFLPFIPVDSAAKISADDSTNWRLRMWQALLPQVPEHLLLGKGYTIPKADFDEMMGNTALANSFAANLDASQGGLALSQDYHNGMLSIVIPLGIWGVLAFLWLVAAGIWALYNNFKHGDPAYRTVNSILFVLFLFQSLSYVSCLGGLQLANEIGFFLGYVGFSIALNNGVCRPVPKPVPATQPVRRMQGFPRPVFQR